MFFDDDYDYLQHLKEASRSSELVLSTIPGREGRTIVSAAGEREEEIQQIPVSRKFGSGLCLSQQTKWK